MTATCNLCSSNITKERFPGIKCGGNCEKLFHIKCARISDDLLQVIKNRSANWLCEDCRSTSNQSNIVDDDDSSEPAHNVLSLSDIMIQLKLMEKKLTALDELKAIVSSLMSENADIKSRVHILEDQLLKQTTKFHHLEADCDFPKQQENACRIIICGLPLKHGDVKGLVINTIKKIGVDIQTDDLVSVEPIHKNINVSRNNNTIKPFLNDFFNVKLSSVELKNNILEQMRKKKVLSTRDLDVLLPQNHPEQRIYIMHQLTSFQTHLYREAKIIKSKFNYKYLWCKSGQIFLRKSTESDVHRIRSFNDIFRLNRIHHPVENITAR